MNKLLLLLLFFSLNLLMFSQECGENINDSFDVEGELPEEWTEYNTSGQVIVSGGRLNFNYLSSKPSVYRAVDNVSGVFSYSFEIESQKNWINVQMNLSSSNGDVITGLIFGNSGSKNIMYATSIDESNNPSDYVGLLDVNFSSNTVYEITLAINTEKSSIDFYIDGVLKASGIGFLQSAANLSRIDFIQYSMYGNSGLFYVDNVKVLQDDVIRQGLSSAINEAQTHLNNVTVGAGIGEYSQGVIDQLQFDIDKATILLNNCSSNQTEVDAEVSAVAASISLFDDSRNWGSADVSITIDPEKILCDKNPIWFGGNNTYNSSGQGLWDATNNHCHYNVIDLANYTGASGYRFPGGTMANLYRWKRAIGLVDQRIDNLNSHGSAGPLSNEFGPDEFGQMLQNTHMNNGVIVVAFNYDTPIDAADYVEYMNAEVGANPNGGIDWAQIRANNGHSEPYNIKYWEIGNELSGDWELGITNYPSDGDDNRGGTTLLKGIVDVYVNGGYRTFTNQRAVKQSSWEQESCIVDGSANQEFYVKFAPVDLNSTFTLTIGDVVWTRVDDLTNSNSTDFHYTVDASSGKITFGDGVKGAIPSGGSNVMLNYRSGEHASFSDYYEAMKAVDPSIEVISCWEAAEFYREMAVINKPFDGVTKHYYPGGTADEGDEYKMVMKQSVDFKSKTTNHIQNLSDNYNASLAGINVRQHLTEFFGGRNVDAVTQMCVMWYDIINTYPDQVGNVMAHSYFKNDNTPMANTGGNFVAAKGLPYHIFTHLHQDKFVDASYEGGSYTYKSTLIKNSYPTASINEAGNVLTLVVPNTQDAQILNASINVANYGFSGENVIGKKWIAKAYDIYAENSTSLPNEVRIEGPFEIELGEKLEDKIQPYSVCIYQWIQEDVTYLSDLNPTVSGVDILEDEGFSFNGSLKVNGIMYEKGISLAVGSTVEYNLNKGYLNFVTDLGLDDAFTGGTVVANIYVDDVLMYNSISLNSNTPSPQLNIDVTDADKLRIVTYALEAGFNGEYIIMGNARLTKSDKESGIDSFPNVSNDIEVVPNPFKQQFTIHLPKYESGMIKLMDMSGKIVHSKPFLNQNTIQQHAISIPDGLYVLIVSTSEVNYVTKIIRMDK